jgi:predicted nucleotidyltransferase
MARPLKEADARFLLRPLTVIFGAPSHVALLRALGRSGTGMTGREVARTAGVAQQSAAEGLARLERAGVVKSIPVGRAYLYTLNRELKIVREGILPLLEKEGEIRSGVFEALRKTFQGEVLSGVVYGSVARGEERPESDLDVCIVVDRESQKEPTDARAGALFGTLKSELGVTLSAFVFARQEFIRGYRSRNPFFANVVQDGERFTGIGLKELVRDQKNATRTR